MFDGLFCKPTTLDALKRLADTYRTDAAFVALAAWEARSEAAWAAWEARSETAWAAWQASRAAGLANLCWYRYGGFRASKLALAQVWWLQRFARPFIPF